jgi:hypothetical protein
MKLGSSWNHEECTYIYVKSENFCGISMKVAVFWDVTRCCMVQVQLAFGRMYYFPLQGKRVNAFFYLKMGVKKHNFCFIIKRYPFRIQLRKIIIIISSSFFPVFLPSESLSMTSRDKFCLHSSKCSTHNYVQTISTMYMWKFLVDEASLKNQYIHNTE